MKIASVLLLALFCFTSVHAEEVYKIKVGKDYKEYSKRELRERVWDLERAVWQLQQRVFQLENANTPVIAPEPEHTWACTIDAMGKPYVGTGSTKAMATAKAIKDCKAGKGQDEFFCKDPKCEQ